MRHRSSAEWIAACRPAAQFARLLIFGPVLVEQGRSKTGCLVQPAGRRVRLVFFFFVEEFLLGLGEIES